ncbi:MAG: bifunctional (p)ppGpp synthetase/guanosine-3',5'-bis(diphosphate) 3'-pyrophosphohydrolase [Alphaproteobacteria bacterium]|nr:bifunctional (p)ppGpp synthetase/guanosine-3',5'-bis(diphosphate) 3'-pyrophosphohydrolase [Alphaproteobacteria bacterium]
MNATIATIVDRIREYAPDADTGPVLRAYMLAVRAHDGQTRASGEDYVHHPLEVADILVGLRMDVDTIATALLHDALEDNPLSKEEMSAEVGPVITELVDGVTKIGKLKFRSKEELQAENFRKMMIAMSRDLRVILVKLADRLHNMRTLEGHRPEKRQRIAEETLEVYAPIANRLGLHGIKTELEDLSFQAIDPDTHARVVDFLEETAANRETYIADVNARLQDLLARNGIEGKISGRAKAPSSIWRKMRKNKVDVADVPDILAFRVLLPTLGDCYAVLGLVHADFPPVPGRIKDYVARPKANGYKSLHTTVIGPNERRIEIQIRTFEMHGVAEQGIASHWRYKEGHLALDPKDVVEISRIREAFETAQEASDATEFMDTVKRAFYADEVFVFTPAGEVKRFPLGATPLDFAYAVHSDVGDHCVGARIDGRMVPLEHTLESGQTIEILTNVNQHPRRDWLEIAKTSSAIAKIRRWLRRQEESTAQRMGRDMLENELERVGWSLEKVERDGLTGPYLKKRGLKEAGPIFAEIARGTRPASEVAKELLPEDAWFSQQEEARRNRLGTLLNRFTRKARSPVLIAGEDGILVHYAGCCAPVPGEPVVGFITRGRGITVHRASCRQLGSLDDARRIEVEWDRKSDARHSNTIVVWCENRTGTLSRIASVCERQKVNIEHAEAKATGGPLASVVLQVAVRDLAELQGVMDSLRKLPEVSHVERQAS